MRRISKTRNWLGLVASGVAVCAIAMVPACSPAPASLTQSNADPAEQEPAKAVNPNERIERSDADWRAALTPEQYHVLRQQGTEPAFTGKYWDTRTKGAYRCAGCGEVLFVSDTKFDSHCGWPSFFAPADSSAVEEHIDTTYGMVRTEVTCKKCGGHLGHVFDDGPTDKGGLRYCINSAALELEAAESSKAQTPTAPKPNPAEKSDQ